MWSVCFTERPYCNWVHILQERKGWPREAEVRLRRGTCFGAVLRREHGGLICTLCTVNQPRASADVRSGENPGSTRDTAE